MKANDVTAAQVRERLSYDPDTGVFTHIMGRRAGERVGTVSQNGYVMIRILGRLRLAHRLAWLLSHDAWPTYAIDHINGDRADNRLVNLRDVPHAANMRNSNNAKKRLLVGAALTPTGKWSSAVHRYGVADPLGEFQTADQANAEYLAAKQRVTDPEKPRPRLRSVRLAVRPWENSR